MAKSTNSNHSEAKEWIKSIAIAVIIAFIVKMFLFDFVVVQGSSMFPTLKNGERLIISKIQYEIGSPEYGDIVVLHHNARVEFVKRIIGKGGDTIEIKSNVVYRNGKALDEPYINSGNYEDFAKVTVPEGKYFVMGDNRPNSLDSRYTEVGFIDRSAIVGHVVFRFWPFDRFGAVSSS